MFIDLTRFGGTRPLRVAVAAIAYLDACEGGTSVHLVGGETLRVAEEAGDIEAQATPQVVTGELLSTPVLTADEIVAAYLRIAKADLPASPAVEPGHIDKRLEDEALLLGERNGFISAERATEQRIGNAVHRRKPR